MQIKFDKVSYSPRNVSIEGVCALEDISFELDHPGLTGIMGEHGSGKRSLLFILSGLLCPERGHVYINGMDTAGKAYRRDPEKPECAFVMRGAELFCEKTTEREFDTLLRGSKLSTEEKAERMHSALSLVGLESAAVIQMAPAALSRLERYRLSIAMALASKPDILLLDEPLEQLDATGRKMLRGLVEKLVDEGCHIVITGNDADFFAEHADRVLVMQNGRLIRSGTARDIFAGYYDLIRNQIPIPEVKKAAQLLLERGVNMPSNIFEYEQFIDRLKIIMWRKQK